MQWTHDSELSRTVFLKTTLLLVAITLNAAESFLPRIPFLPWLKPGLANCVTVLWIIRYGGVDALLFSLMRIWLVGFYFGFSLVTLSLGLSGGLLATCVMAITWNVLGRRKLIGTIGVAILGALFHNLGQITVVYFLLARYIHLFYQIPFMIVAAIVFGSIVGMLAPLLSQLADSALDATEHGLVSLPANENTSRLCTAISIAALLLSISLAFVENRPALIILAILITALVQLLVKGSLQRLFLPIRRFWLLFLFVACFHLFLSGGTKLPQISFITYEGVQATVVQWLRLWCWLQMSFVFSYFRFHTVMFRVLSFVFKSHNSTLYAGLLAVEDFPEVFNLMRERIKIQFRAAFRCPIATFELAIRQALDGVADFVVRRHSLAMVEEESMLR